VCVSVSHKGKRARSITTYFNRCGTQRLNGMCVKYYNSEPSAQNHFKALDARRKLAVVYPTSSGGIPYKQW